ncbi:DUF3152 domain-containing protein [Cellulomonas fengjieae]|uniref:DUF3152 domain-containing protein n=1 Tax=Cellulomonas fengjieae TaxID=2819978 RepID=UPI0027DE67EC|nr:DUF3152 domain-containing protein [Cellulomonas fengjieae]
MTTPEPLGTDQGPVRARRLRPVPRRGTRRVRRGPSRAGRTVPALVAVALGLSVGVGTGLWTENRPRTSAAAEETPAAAALPGAEAVERFGAQSRSGDRAMLAPDPVEVPLGMLPSEPPPGIVALPPGLTAQDMAAGLLSADIPESGAGTFSVVPGTDPGPGTGAVRTVRVEVEDGLAVDGPAFAATVMATLNDPRGWGADGSLSFARTDGPAELRVLLASPTAVDDLCAPLDTAGEVSCGTRGHAVLNLRRWVLATEELAADKVLYRQYLVNHEVGHLLGHRHERCSGPGELAPLMQQQSYRAAPCIPNAWPFP